MSVVAPRHVVAAAAAICGLTPAMLTGRTRVRRAVCARWLAMAALHERLGMSSAAIGAVLGGRDHSTVLHGLARVECARVEGDSWPSEASGFACADTAIDGLWRDAAALARGDDGEG